MDDLISAKRGRIVGAIILNLLLVVNLIYMFSLLRGFQGRISLLLMDEPVFRRGWMVFSISYFCLTALVVFIWLYTLNLSKLKICYNEVGFKYKSLFRRWEASWPEVERAYATDRSLVVKSGAGGFTLPLKMLDGDIERFKSYVPSGVWLEKDTAVCRERRKSLKLLAVVALVLGALWLAFFLYIQPYLTAGIRNPSGETEEEKPLGPNIEAISYRG